MSIDIREIPNSAILLLRIGLTTRMVRKISGKEAEENDRNFYNYEKTRRRGRLNLELIALQGMLDTPGSYSDVDVSYFLDCQGVCCRSEAYPDWLLNDHNVILKVLDSKKENTVTFFTGREQ